MPEKAYATAAFARKEGVSCGGCHYRINRPNQAGLDYMRQGFTLNVGEGKMPKLAAEEFGKYFSIYGQSSASKQKGKDYTTSDKIKLYGGGYLESNFSFFMETTLNPPASQEVADLYAQYTLGNEDRYGFMRVGQFLPMLFSGENTWEFANDVSAAFARDRRKGLAAGYNYGKGWGEIAVVASTGDTTGNRVDVVPNIQYIFTDNGSSLGTYYWNGYYNTDSNNDGKADSRDSYKRYGLVGQFNEIEKLLLSAGYSAGRGDSSAGGKKKISGLFAQAEYLFSDKLTVLLNVVDDEPDTSVSRDRTTAYKTAIYYWFSQYVSGDIAYVYKDLQAGGNDSSVSTKLRLMF